MNWLIRKRFTYFYNKFRGVNRMHYIKWCKYFITHIILVAVEGLGTLDHCFIATHYSQRG